MRPTGLLIVLATVSMLPPSPAVAQNTSPSFAQRIMIGQPAMDFYLSDAVTERWFEFEGKAGQSYCVEVVMKHDEMDQGWPKLYIYKDLAGTDLIISNITGTATEPHAYYLSRGCFVAPNDLAERATIRLTDQMPSGTYDYKMRMVETTLWASWFFIGGDYNSFLLLRNTTDTAVAYTIRWRSATGTEVGSTTGSVLAKGALGINARTFITDPATNFNGTVEIAHNGSPEALVGQVTSLSATTGISYDSALFQRRPW